MTLAMRAEAIYKESMTNERILVVDDDHEIVRLVRSYLEQAGYTVLIAHDGEEAMHQLRTRTT